VNFSEIFNSYIRTIGCTSKEISVVSGLSVAQISKYKNGKRTPRQDSIQLKALANGLSILAENNGINLDKKEILLCLTDAIKNRSNNSDIISENFEQIVLQLKINMSDLASFMNYDASFLSKIKSSDRHPADSDAFCRDVGNFIAKRYQNRDGRVLLSATFGGNPEQYKDEKVTVERVYRFLTSEQTPPYEVIESFLTSVNKSVTASESRNIPFKIPSIPKPISKTKFYFGISGMKSAEADFFRYTILSSSKKPVFIHSDMGMSEVDDKQEEKLTQAVRMLISKGIQLTLIHNINRPIEEMLTGIKVWLPFYMTGMVSSYYFDELLSTDYPQILCTSGVAAMQGEGISNEQDSSIFLVTTNKDQLDYFNKKRDYMLSRATPLIKIFSSANEADYLAFVKNSMTESGIYEMKKDTFPNISFTVNSGKWVSINSTVSDPIHFTVFNKKLINAIEIFLKN